MLFGGFNPYNIDVKVSFRNNFTNSGWETGLDIIAIDTLKKYLDKNEFDCEELGQFIPTIEIPQSKNPIRGFTLDTLGKNKLIMNGALQVRCFCFQVNKNSMLQ